MYFIESLKGYRYVKGLESSTQGIVVPQGGVVPMKHESNNDNVKLRKDFIII